MNENIFCERLKELRIERKSSIVELGKLLDVNNSTISRWENGVMLPNIAYLYKIAKLFNVSADYLIGLENE